jgi:hypothetical protein
LDLQEGKGDWRKLHNKELRDLYCSRSIVTVIKSGRMSWMGIRSTQNLSITKHNHSEPLSHSNHYDKTSVSDRKTGNNLYYTDTYFHL